MNISNFSTTRLAFAGRVLLAALIGACSSSGNNQGSSGNSTTGSGGANGSGGSSSGSGGTATTGGSTGRGGTANTGGSVGAGGVIGAGGGAGAGGVIGGAGAGGVPTNGSDGAAIQKFCADKVTVMNPVITDFETYTGTTDIAQYVFPFGGGTVARYGGPYAYSGVFTTTAVANYMLLAAAGHAGLWAIAFSATNESVWGGAVAFWLNCVNASAYRGVSFWARGQVPRGLVSVTLDTEDTRVPDPVNPAAGGTCPGTDTTCLAPVAADLPVGLDWTQVTILWPQFVGGLRGPAAYIPGGDNIVGLAFTAGLNYVANPIDGGLPAYVPVPADIRLDIDDIAFVP
jgi:hypothetical protein